MSTGTVRLHRVLRAKPDKIYRAFLDPEALARWLPPNGFTCKVDHLDAKVGGTFRMAFRNFGTGNGHAFGGAYLELVPGKRIRYTDKFDDASAARAAARLAAAMAYWLWAVSKAFFEMKPFSTSTRLFSSVCFAMSSWPAMAAICPRDCAARAV